MEPNYENLRARAVSPWVAAWFSDHALHWITVVVGWAWQQFRSRHVGMYEILDYDSTLELCDVKGKTAVFRRFQKVRFLQDNIIGFQDHAWGDGDLFAEYTCVPGVVAYRYRDGERWNVLISLRETKSRGDIEDIYIERTVKNGFVRAEEWRQTTI